MSKCSILETILEVVQALTVLCEASKDDLRLLKDAVSDVVDLLDSGDTSSNFAPSDSEWEVEDDSSDEAMADDSEGEEKQSS